MCRFVAQDCKCCQCYCLRRTSAVCTLSISKDDQSCVTSCKSRTFSNGPYSVECTCYISLNFLFSVTMFCKSQFAFGRLFPKFCIPFALSTLVCIVSIEFNSKRNRCSATSTLFMSYRTTQYTARCIQRFVPILFPSLEHFNTTKFDVLSSNCQSVCKFDLVEFHHLRQSVI